MNLYKFRLSTTSYTYYVVANTMEEAIAYTKAKAMARRGLRPVFSTDELVEEAELITRSGDTVLVCHE